MKSFILLICYGVFTLTLLGQNRIQFDSIVATVNGNPITLSDIMFDTYMIEMRLAKTYKGTEYIEKVNKLRENTRQNLIETVLIYSEFKRYEFTLPQQQIQNTIDTFKKGKSREEFEKELHKIGLTYEYITEKAKKKVAQGIMLYEFCYKGIDVSPKEIYDYYNTNLSEYKINAKINLNLLLVKDKNNINIIKSSIKQQTPFSTLVKKYSKGTNIENGGNLGWLELTKLNPIFLEVTKNKNIKDILGPIDIQNDTCFLEIEDLEKERYKQFKEIRVSLKNKILVLTKRDSLNNYLNKLKKNAIIKIYE